MRALIFNGTLKASPQTSNTEGLARYVGGRLSERGVEVEHVRVVDHDVAPGVVSQAVRPGDGWPALHAKVVAADIVVFATPIWMGPPGSVIKGVWSVSMRWSPRPGRTARRLRSTRSAAWS